MFLKYFQKIDDISSYLFSSVCNEKKLLKSIFKNSRIFYVDIGTNEGSFVDFLSKIFKFKKIVCFEPINNLAIKLDKKFSHHNIEVNNLALSNISSSKKFYEYYITSQSSLYKQNNTYKSLKNLKKIYEVKTISFDKKFNKKIKIDFCKIDAQGEEINILKGMKKNLKLKNVRLIKIELSFLETYTNVGSNYFEVISLLKKFNYKLISISKIKFKENKILFADAYFLSS